MAGLGDSLSKNGVVMKNFMLGFVALALSLPVFAGDLETVKQRMKTDFGQECDNGLFASHDALIQPQAFTFEYKSHGGTAQTYTLFQMFCMAGAYNETDVFYLQDPSGAIKALQFAKVNVNDDYKVTGIATTPFLVNARFDPKTLMLNSHEKGRGVGDAFTAGTWKFSLDGFTLVRFDVDLTFDGEANPHTVFQVK
jgi:hypothetical protein